MFQHIAILKFKPGASREAIDKYFAEFPGLMARIPQVKRWRIGWNEGPGGESHVQKFGLSPNYDVGLTLEFDSPADYAVYAESEAHQSFINAYVKDILAERVVVQYNVPPKLGGESGR